MTRNPFKSDAGHSVLRSIREGLPVYDRDNRKVGNVKRVQFRRLRDDFILIDSGLLSDCLATSEQIAELTDERLTLNVASDQLVRN